MNNFIRIVSLITGKRNNSSYDRLTASLIDGLSFCTNTLYINIDKIVNYSYPSRHSYYYHKPGNYDDEEYIGLDVFEVKMDNGDIYFIEKKYFEDFKRDIETINIERYVKNINIMAPIPAETKKRRK